VVPRRRARRLTCPCGWSTAAVDDQSTRRWRRLELGAVELVLQAEMRRLNSKIRLITHGGYGRHGAAAVIAMISLCCSGLTVTLPRGGPSAAAGAARRAGGRGDRVDEWRAVRA
jgi:hypothetical protein